MPVSNSSGSISPGMSAATALGDMAINTITASISGHKNRKLVREQNALNRQFSHDEAALAYQRQVEQWNRENMYNSPQAQMSRYVAAGLNPNLIYDNLDNGASLSSVSQASTPRSDTPQFDLPKVNFSNAIQQYQAIRSFDTQQQLAAQQIAQSAAQTEYFNALKEKAQSERVGQDLENAFNTETKELRKQLIDIGYSEKAASIMAQKAHARFLQVQELNLGYNNEFLRRTMENRVLAAGVGIDLLRAQISELRSKSHLNDAQREQLGALTALYNSELRVRGFAPDLDEKNMSMWEKMRYAQLYDLNSAAITGIHRNKILEDIYKTYRSSSTSGKAWMNLGGLPGISNAPSSIPGTVMAFGQGLAESIASWLGFTQ